MIKIHWLTKHFGGKLAVQLLVGSITAVNISAAQAQLIPDGSVNS